MLCSNAEETPRTSCTQTGLKHFRYFAAKRNYPRFRHQILQVQEECDLNLFELVPDPSVTEQKDKK